MIIHRLLALLPGTRGKENLMDGTRRGFFRAAVAVAGAAAGAAAAPGLAQGQEHQRVPSDFTLRVKSLESLLVEKGLVDRAALDALVDMFEHKIGPRNGWGNPLIGRCF